LVINIKEFDNKRLIVKFIYSLGPKERLEVLKWVGGSMRLAVGLDCPFLVDHFGSGVSQFVKHI